MRAWIAPHLPRTPVAVDNVSNASTKGKALLNKISNVKNSCRSTTPAAVPLNDLEEDLYTRLYKCVADAGNIGMKLIILYV